MKRFLRCVAVVLVIATLFAIPVYAEDANTYASRLFCSYCAYIYVVEDNFFQVWVEVETLSAMEELGTTSIKIQRSSDGTNWTTMKTYKPDIYTWMIDEDTALYSDCIGYYGTIGYYYRAYVTVYAKDSIGTAEAYLYTEPVYLHG